MNPLRSLSLLPILAVLSSHAQAQAPSMCQPAQQLVGLLGQNAPMTAFCSSAFPCALSTVTKTVTSTTTSGSSSFTIPPTPLPSCATPTGNHDPLITPLCGCFKAPKAVITVTVCCIRAFGVMDSTNRSQSTMTVVLPTPGACTLGANVTCFNLIGHGWPPIEGKTLNLSPGDPFPFFITTSQSVPAIFYLNGTTLLTTTVWYYTWIGNQYVYRPWVAQVPTEDWAPPMTFSNPGYPSLAETLVCQATTHKTLTCTTSKWSSFMIVPAEQPYDGNAGTYQIQFTGSTPYGTFPAYTITLGMVPAVCSC